MANVGMVPSTLPGRNLATTWEATTRRYVRLNSAKYRNWQVLAYESTIDKDLLYKEQELPPEAKKGKQLTCAVRWAAVDAEKKVTGTPGIIAESEGIDSDDPDGLAELEGINSAMELPSECRNQQGVMEEERDAEIRLTQLDTPEADLESKPDSATEANKDSDELDATDDAMATDPEEDLRLRFLAAAASASDDELVAESDHRFTHYERKGETLHQEDYAHELAFLPDLSEKVPIKLDYNGTNVKCSAHTPEQATRLTELLKRNEKIMISSGNTLPPPAYGVVCDIDVGDHPPIKQRARRVALKYLKALYELLKGLLRAKLVSFSKSPGASPIVIVLKKNGVDIRLCIDYKKVNAITMIMEYAMPLVDDLISELEKYLWFCSLDAASGFGAVMMTSRARRISAFVCALGHFEWLRMPFGLKNAPMIYQRMIDNALWGYVQPKGGWSEFARRIRRAEEVAATRRQRSDPTQPPSSLTKFAADNRALAELDPLQELIDSPEGDMFTCGEPDQSVLTPVFTRRSFVGGICFGGITFEECLETLDRLLTRLAECRISVSFSKSIFVQPKVDFLSHEVTSEGIRADPKKTLPNPFPKSKKGIQAFLGALNYYGRFIQNLAVDGAVLYQLKDSDFDGNKDLSAAQAAFAELKSRVVTAPILRHFDSAKEVHIMLFANDWALSSTLMQMHDDKLHPVRFCGRVLKENEVNYHPAEKEVLALLQLLKICHTLLAGKVLHVYTRFSTLEWVFQSTSLYGLAVSFAVLLSPYHLKIKRVRERDVDFVQLLQASITPHVGLDESLEHIAPPSKNSATVRMDPELLYAKIPRHYKGHWDIEIAASAYLSSTTVNLAEYTGMNNGVKAAIDRGVTDLVIVGDSRLVIQQSMGVIACKKETLQVELARHKELTKNLNSVKYLHVIRLYNSAADSMAIEALETQISRVVLNAERKVELKTLNRIPEILYTAGDSTDDCEEGPKACPITRSQQRNKQAGTSKRGRLDSAGATEPDLNRELEIQRRQPARRIETGSPSSQGDEVELNAPRAPSADDIDPAVVQAERRRRIDRAQDEELRWADLKAYLSGELSQLLFRRVRNAGKVADDFVLSEDGLLYRHKRSLRRGGDDEPSLNLRVVVPTTMVDEVLQNCHNLVTKGLCGPTIESSPTTTGLGYMQMRCGTFSRCNSKIKPHLRGYSPGNSVSDRPFHIVSMDFVIPLPRTRRGNTTLLLLHDHFTGFVIAKAMAETGALEVAKVFEENAFRRFGAPSLVRHDRDPRFMSEVFQKFSEVMQSISRATRSYRPQANGQQERSVKTMIQTVRVYVEDPLQADWDDIAEKKVYAIKKLERLDSAGDPILPVRHGQNSSPDLTAPAEWCREANRQREVALRLAAEYQLKEEARRAKEHNESLSRVERRATPQARGNSEPAELGGASAESVEAPAESTKSLFKEGDQVWLFMERVKQGLTKKLAHRWHDPFRVKRKVEEFAYELELPDKSGYRFYPVIHVSRLKKVVDTEKRPTTPLIAGLEEDQRFDLDEELLPEDSWEPDEGASQYEVEAILDDELP
ncbi:LOW QUALITY PROTEIN: reverse transcriptase [Phytophthora palmivora]|uniref:Reverse transcriptase n=1 Tax=Phytophthora palmivora TaxID=4796 RepID=A0A2P4X9Z9_9STRA|nr:LOW QUALITY PROTEIN: reverse transcriptase [Phytophthora palmivora]